jgi:hypothetical protein
VKELASIVESRGYEAVPLEWPLSVDIASLRKVTTLDWVVLDVGNSPEGAVALGWLDGYGVPLARLQLVPPCNPAPPRAEAALYRNNEVGYNEDRLTWSNPEELTVKFEQMVDAITAPARRINTHQEAENYFQGAERRRIRVFLSYASADREIAGQISRALKQKCESVFDYQDGESLDPGTGYPEQLYSKLAASEIGVPLLSQEYLKSGPCKHEAQGMCASWDAGNMYVHPLNIDGCKPPDFFRVIQYDRIDQHQLDAEWIVDRVLRNYDTWCIGR